MKAQIITAILLMTVNVSYAGNPYPGLQVDVSREGARYTLQASFDTPLNRCAAYSYLTDYEAAKLLPGVIESSAVRETGGKVRVDRTADEQILFVRIRLHSVMEYTEQAQDGIEFKQLYGDSKLFQGNWRIEPNPQGTTLRFQGLWEPDTLIPLFIIDHFARHGLVDRFSAVARLAHDRKDILSASCIDQSDGSRSNTH